MSLNIERFFDTSAEFSVEKISEFYSNSTGETINLLELLQYSYIPTKYETISPCDMKMDTHDDKKMYTPEKEIDNDYVKNDQDSVNLYDESAQQENMDTLDENNYFVTHDVFMGFPEANNPQFTNGEDLYIDEDTDDHDDAAAATAAAAAADYHIDSMDTLPTLDLL